MKILYLIHQFYPEFTTGTEKFTLNIAKMIASAGHEVIVVSYGFDDSNHYAAEKYGVYYRYDIYSGVTMVKLKPKTDDRLHYDITKSVNIFRFASWLLYTERPDLLHVTHTMRMVDFVYAAKSLGIPIVMTLTDYFLLCPRIFLTPSIGGSCGGPSNGARCAEQCPDLAHEFVRQRLQTATKAFLTAATRLYAPSQFIADLYGEEVSGLKVNVRGHGIQRPRKQIESEQRKHALKVLYAGSLNSFKGIHILLAALELIDNDNIHLNIYGTGTDTKYIQSVMSAVAADKRITYVGTYSDTDIDYVFSQNDIVVIPSLFPETYCFVLYEALVRNVPVIASRIGALSEKVEEGRNGFLFAPGDIDGLAQILTRLLEDPSVLLVLQKCLQEFMTTTIEQEACAYERDYLQIVAGRGQGQCDLA